MKHGIGPSGIGRKGESARVTTIACLAFLAMTLSCSNLATSTTKPKRYAVVIGVAVLQSGDNVCPYTDKDADSMGKALEAGGWTVTRRLIEDYPGDYWVPAGNYNGETPTYAAIKSAIAELSVKVGGDPNASVLVYYSGHGAPSSLTSLGSLVPYDAETSSGFQLSKMISAATMTQWMSAIPCYNKILILDSCFSGNFVDSGGSIDLSPEQTSSTAESSQDYIGLSNGTLSYSDLIAKAETRAFGKAMVDYFSLLAASVGGETAPDVLTISAAGSNEESFSDQYTLKQGVFTYYLLEAAKNGDANGDGYVSATEAYAYAKNMIKTQWNPGTINDYSIDPFLPHISGGAGDLVLFAPSS